MTRIKISVNLAGKTSAIYCNSVPREKYGCNIFPSVNPQVNQTFNVLSLFTDLSIKAQV